MGDSKPTTPSLRKSLEFGEQSVGRDQRCAGKCDQDNPCPPVMLLVVPGRVGAVGLGHGSLYVLCCLARRRDWLGVSPKRPRYQLLNADSDE